MKTSGAALFFLVLYQGIVKIYRLSIEAEIFLMKKPTKSAKKGVVVFPGTWSGPASFGREVDGRLPFEFLLSRKK